MPIKTRQIRFMHVKALFLVIVMSVLAMPVSLGSYSASTISSTGRISYAPYAYLTVDPDKTMSRNSLSLGFWLDYSVEWKAFRDRPAQRQLAEEANFKAVHLCDRHLGTTNYAKGVGPCLYWDEKTQKGTFDWTTVDSVVRAILDIGAEPFITLSRWRPEDRKPTVPPGMAVDPETYLPYPESYGNFAAAWVQHFKNVGLQVKYYEIFDEIQSYIGWYWDVRNEPRVMNYVKLFNAAYTKMHQTSQQVRVSFDASTLKWVFPKLLSDAVGIDFFSFHKYDDWHQAPNAVSDQEMFKRAEDVYLQTEDRDTYTVEYVRNAWFSKRGVTLPAILSAGNWNAAYGPSDERVQEMAGAVRTALVIRMGILKGLEYSLYFTLTSDAVWETRTYGSGRGFGMIDCDLSHTSSVPYNKPWYPYYVQKIMGSNLAVGDPLLNATSSSPDIRILAWKHNSSTNILLICTSSGPKTVLLNGLSGQMSFLKIDDTIPFTAPEVQYGTINAKDPLTLNGYTVMLLQS